MAGIRAFSGRGLPPSRAEPESVLDIAFDVDVSRETTNIRANGIGDLGIIDAVLVVQIRAI